MEELTHEEILDVVTRIVFKTTEVSTLLRDGKTIVAHEKLGGVIKNLTALGGRLQACVRQDATPINADK